MRHIFDRPSSRFRPAPEHARPHPAEAPDPDVEPFGCQPVEFLDLPQPQRG